MLTAQSIRPTDFLAMLTPQCLVLTPNRRLATHLRQQLLETLPNQQSVYAPTILAYQDWLNQSQQQLLLHGQHHLQLLDNTALDWLFMASMPDDIPLLSRPEVLSTTARQAWQLAHEGCLDWQALSRHSHIDYRWFASWAKNVEATLIDQQATDSYHWLSLHANALATYSYQHYTSIYWYGFLDFSKLQQQLQGLLHEAGCQQAAFVATHEKPCIKPNIIKALEPTQEIQGMLHQAKITYDQGFTSIACVVPNLASQRSKIVTEVWRCFEPNTPWPSYRHDFPVNISGGYPLSELAPVQTAVALISLWLAKPSYETLAHLFMSPYWGDHSKPSELMDLEPYLRQIIADELPLASWLSLLPEKHPASSWLILQWQPLVGQSKQLPSTLYPSLWVQKFKVQWQAFAWPGPKTLDSWHYQLLQAVLRTLNTLAGYDSFMGQLSLTKMLQLWQKLLSENLFQPQSKGARVEILGVLEATGLTWDHLWVCQLQAQSFPEAPAPNPFLPVAWQKAAGLPRSCPKREQAYANTLLQTWQQQAGELTLSYSETIDGIASEGSRLLTPWQPAVIMTPPLDISTTIALETIHEHAIPAMGHELTGSSYHLQAFLACPFQAFGHYRLGMVGFQEKSTTLTPLQRGQVVHRSLQLIWQQLASQKALLALSEAEREALIKQAARESLYSWQTQLSAILWQQQFAWLTRLLKDWLQFECERTAFTIHSLEQNHSLKLNQYNLKLRSDRIDHCDDGSLMVLDYKTGTSYVSHSFKTPLMATQMPLYLLALQAKTAGFAYVTLKPGKVAWEGVSDSLADDKLYPFCEVSKKASGEAKSYAEQLHAWQDELEALVDDVANNQAALMPTGSACQFCDLASLCRKDELLEG